MEGFCEGVQDISADISCCSGSRRIGTSAFSAEVIVWSEAWCMTYMKMRDILPNCVVLVRFVVIDDSNRQRKEDRIYKSI